MLIHNLNIINFIENNGRTPVIVIDSDDDCDLPEEIHGNETSIKPKEVDQGPNVHKGMIFYFSYSRSSN